MIVPPDKEGYLWDLSRLSLSCARIGSALLPRLPTIYSMSA